MNNPWNNLPPGITDKNIEDLFNAPKCIFCEKELSDDEFDSCVEIGSDFICGGCRTDAGKYCD